MAQRHALTLRCMYGCLMSGPDIEVLPLFENIDDFTVTQLVKQRGSVILREQTLENRTKSTVFARLTTRGQIIQFETFIAHTSIEPPPGDFLSAYEEHSRLALPLSAPQDHHYIYLRPLDTIDFSDLNFKIEVSTTRQDHITPPPKVFVESAVSPATMPSSESQSAAELKRQSEIDNSDEDGDATDIGEEEEEFPKITTLGKATSSPKVNIYPVLDADNSPAATRPSSNKAHDSQARAEHLEVPEEQPELSESNVAGAPSAAGLDAEEDAEEGAAKVENHVGVSVELYRELKRKRPDPYDLPDDEKPTRRNPYKKHRGMSKPVEVVHKDEDEELDEQVDEEEVAAAKPVKKIRGTSKPAESDDDAEVETVVSAKKRRGLPKAAEASDDEADELNRGQTISKKPRKALRSVVKTPIKKATSSRTATPVSSALQGKTPKVLLSCSALKGPDKTWMTRNKIPVVQATPGKRTDFVCVVRDKSLPSTVKVLKTLIRGMPVVGDAWITTSRSENQILDPEDYIHSDLESLDSEEHEAARRTVFSGHILIFTVNAAGTWTTDWPEVQQLAADAGAVRVYAATAATTNALEKEAVDSVIIFGNDDSADDDAETLMAKTGHTVYNRSLFAHTIIQAELDLDSHEFKLSSPLGGTKKGKAKSKK